MDQISQINSQIEQNKPKFNAEKEKSESLSELYRKLFKECQKLCLNPEEILNIKESPLKKKFLEEKQKLEEMLKNLEKDKQSAESKFHVKARDLYKKSKEIQQKMADALMEINKKNENAKLKSNVISYLIQNKQSREQTEQQKTVFYSTPPKKQKITINDSNEIYAILKQKENSAARKIQRNWKKYIKAKQNLQKEIEIIPLYENIDKERECVLLYKSKRKIFEENNEENQEKSRKEDKIMPIMETFGRENNITPPDFIEQGIQANENL